MSIHYEITPVMSAGIKDLNPELIYNYFLLYRNIDLSLEQISKERLYENFEITVCREGKTFPSLAGLLLFGKNPKKYLYQSGITVIKYKKKEKDYDYIKREINGSLLSEQSSDGKIVVPGILDRTLQTIKELLPQKVSFNNAKREVKYNYPFESIREAVVNAVAHRDYTIKGIDITIEIYC